MENRKTKTFYTGRTTQRAPTRARTGPVHTSHSRPTGPVRALAPSTHWARACPPVRAQPILVRAVRWASRGPAQGLLHAYKYSRHFHLRGTLTLSLFENLKSSLFSHLSSGSCDIPRARSPPLPAQLRNPRTPLDDRDAFPLYDLSLHSTQAAPPLFGP